MDIKKALLFIENHSADDVQYAVREITAELADHLNNLASQLSEYEKEYLRAIDCIKEYENKLEMCREALEWYGEEQNWKFEKVKETEDFEVYDMPAHHDKGQKARTTLKKMEE